MDSQKSSLKIGRQIQSYIASHQLRYGCAPGLKLIQMAFSEVPAAIVDAHLSHLVRAGFIMGDEVASPGISSVFLAAPRIPVQGRRINLRDQSKTRIGNESLAFSLAGVGYASPPESYAIQVPDDTMIGANLARGDYAILAPAPMRSGDIVAAIIGDVLALRRYVIITDIPHLMAENPTTPELVPAYNAVIQGVLWASLRIEPCNERFSQRKAHKVDYTKPLGSRLLRKRSHSPRSLNRADGPSRRLPKLKKGLYLEVAQPAVRFCVNEQPAESPKTPKLSSSLSKADKPSRRPTRE